MSVLFNLTKLLKAKKCEEPMHFEYCVQYRSKRYGGSWIVINWSVGPLKRAREALKYMLADNTYRQYEYRVACRRLTDWVS